jgi:hypothetical protein
MSGKQQPAKQVQMFKHPTAEATSRTTTRTLRMVKVDLAETNVAEAVLYTKSHYKRGGTTDE